MSNEGPTQIYPERWLESPPAAVLDIIFIHGLGGGRFDTWQAKEAFWPRWLAEQFPTCRIYLIGYDSQIFAGLLAGEGASIQDLALALLDGIASREQCAPHILLVAHSLGGLIVKQILRRCVESANPNYNAIGQSVAGVAFLGTPHQGAQAASSLNTLLRAFKSKQVYQLAYSDDNLIDLNDFFRSWAARQNANIRSFYETERTGGIHIVDKVTANPGVLGSEPVAVQANHIDICKPATRKAPVYESMCAMVRQILKTIASSSHAHTEDGTGTPSKDDGLDHKPEDGWALDASTYGVPLPTREMVPRTTAIEKIIRLLMDINSTSSSMIALVGHGGSGKSTTAAMLATNPEIESSFPDGVFWVTLGQVPDLALCQGTWLNFISQRPLSFPSVTSARAFLAAHFNTRKALLIIDDVWTASDLAALAVAGPNCRTLITTRERIIAQRGTSVVLDELEVDEAVALLRLRSTRGYREEEDLKKLAEKLGRLPLALELAAYQLGAGTPPAELIAALEDELQAVAALTIPGGEFEHDVEVAKNLSLDACLNLSVRRMPAALLEQFSRLSVIRPNSAFGATTVSSLCKLSLHSARQVLHQLWSMSLLEEDTYEHGDANYRMHALIRAKARMSLVEQSTDLSPDDVVLETTRSYLQRSNAHFPESWHLVLGDRHLRDNLVYYLIQIASDAALVSLLTTCALEERSANSWHLVRIEHAKEELFGVETQQIFNYFVGKRGCTALALEGLVLSHLTLASLSDMNKDIDKTLCLALLESELWTEGQAASHAKRRFSPDNMLQVALWLSEPLRSMTLLYALKMAFRCGPDPDMAEQLALAATAFEGQYRIDIARQALGMMALPLGARNANDVTNSKRPAASRTRYLRAALSLVATTESGEIDNWTPDFWIDIFLHNYECASLNRVKGGIEFGDRLDSYPHTIRLIETLLFLSDYPNNDFAKRAETLVNVILDDVLVDENGYERLRFVARAKRTTDVATLREVALAALTVPASMALEEPSNRVLLSVHEGVDGVARMIAARFGNDPELYRKLDLGKDLSPLALAFLQEVLIGAPTDDFMDWLATSSDGIVRRFTWSESIGPEDKLSSFKLSHASIPLIRTLTASGLFDNRVNTMLLLSELSRIEGNLDRIALLETFLPCIDHIDAGAAKEFCAKFANPQSAATAWLALGTRVDSDCRDDFLMEAILRLPDCLPTSALEVLSTYIRGYCGKHAVEIARAAAAVAAGIGDHESMRCVFAGASIAIEDPARSATLRAAIWYRPNTMPTHAPLPPIARCHSIVNVPFWQMKEVKNSSGDPKRSTSVFLGASPLAHSAFHTLVIERLSDVREQSSRTTVGSDLADIAQEYHLRGDRETSVRIARAIYQTAKMYR